MKWKQTSKYHLTSDCGKYTVAKTTHAGTAKYTAWRKGSPAEMLGAFDEPGKAKARGAVRGMP